MQADLLPLLTAYWKSMALHVAARLGVADLLREQPRSADELAPALRVHPQALHRLLRALASDGVFEEDANSRFALTPLSRRLLSGTPDSQRSAAITMGEEHYRVWGELLYSIQTGEPAWDRVIGQPVFEYFANNPRAAQLFDETMTGIHGAETAAMLDAYDFSPFSTLVDVGGGAGGMLLAILQRYPRLQGVLFDREHVVARARQHIEAAGLQGRCRTTAGNFFASVPPGGDAYIMRHIIHDWNDEQALTILRHCRAVLPATGRLLLVESVIAPGNAPCPAKYLDLTMLLIPGGMERTESQFRTLLGQASFRLERLVPTPSSVQVIEAVPC